MADPIELLRGILTEAVKTKKDLATAKAEIVRLNKLLAAPKPPVVSPPVVVPPVTTPTAGNITLRGRKIYRANGTEIIARGPEKTIADIEDAATVDAMAATGANAVRMLLTLDAANGRTPSDFDAILTRAAFHGMTVWVSLYTWHDEVNNAISPALGGGNFYELNGGTREQPALCYLGMWKRQWLKDLMHKHRANVIIDAAQEYKAPDRGDVANQEAWAASAERAIRFFRAEGYTQPLEIMANSQGRDLSGIIRHGDRVRKADTVLVDGQPQTMFGWQAYWGTPDGWYPRWQGELLLGKGKVISAAEAMAQFVAKAAFPIQVGLDNNPSATGQFWKAQVDAAASLGLSWLWWSWRDGTIESHVGGAEARDYVLNSANGFKGASSA